MAKKVIKGTLETLGKRKVTKASGWANYYKCVVEGEEMTISISPDTMSQLAEKQDIDLDDDYSNFDPLEEGMDIHVIETAFDGKFSVLMSTFGLEYDGANSTKKSSAKKSTTKSSSKSSNSSSAKTEEWTIDRIKKISHDSDYDVYRVENTEGEEGLLFKKEGNDHGLKVGDTQEFEVSKNKEGEVKIKVPYRPKETGGSNKGSSKSKSSGDKASGKASSYFAGNVSAIIAQVVAQGGDQDLADEWLEYWAAKTLEFTERLS